MTEKLIYRPVEVLNSPAMRVMSRAAIMVLSRLEIELALGWNNGSLRWSSDNSEEYRVSRADAESAILEIEALGLAEVTRIPGEPNAHRITYHGLTQRSRGTNEWRRHKTLEEAREAKRAGRHAIGRA